MLDIFNSKALQSWAAYFFPRTKDWQLLPPVEWGNPQAITTMWIWFTSLDYMNSEGGYLLYHEAQTLYDGDSHNPMLSQMVGYDVITDVPWYEFRNASNGMEEVFLHFDKIRGSLFYQMHQQQLTIGHGPLGVENDFSGIFQSGLHDLTEEARKIGKVTFLNT